MDQPTQDQPLSEDQPSSETPPETDDELPFDSEPIPEVGPPAKLPESMSQRILKFAVGFFGWFLVTYIVYGQKMDVDGLLLFANIGILVFLLVKRSFYGWGMLSALAVNLIISLILGSFLNALCFIPFFKH